MLKYAYDCGMSLYKSFIVRLFWHTAAAIEMTQINTNQL